MLLLERGLENRRSLVCTSALLVLFPRIDNSHCDRIHSSFTVVHCFDDFYVGKHPVVWEEYCSEYLLKELQESMDRCTGRHDITEIRVRIHQPYSRTFFVFFSMIFKLTQFLIG